jgi:hypothetical protein
MQDIEKPYYPALGGPLVLLSIGLLVNLGVLVASLAKLWSIFDAQQWRQLATLHPDLPTLLRVELIGTVFFLGFTLIVARAHFCKLRSAPPQLIAYSLLEGVFSLVDYWLARSIPVVMERAGETMVLSWLVWGVSCLFFIPYLLFSRRAKGTYVH